MDYDSQKIFTVIFIHNYLYQKYYNEDLSTYLF